MRRLLVVLILTFVVSSALALVFQAPLEEPANPSVTPPPAKAPWYFLGLQELVGYSAFIGGILVPGLVVLGLIVIPWVDNKNKNVGLWLQKGAERKWMINGAVVGLVLTCLAVFVGVNFPAREFLSNYFSHQFWFDLINPAAALQLVFIAWFFIVKRITGSARLASIALFSCFVVALIVLTITGTWLRGPNWDFFMPWESQPSMPLKY